MNIKKNILKFFLLLLLSQNVNSQDFVSISFHQDLKLLAFGDNIGNRAGTFDILTRLKYQFSQNRYGYLVVHSEFEKAFLDEHYTRFGAGAGYTLNNFFSHDLNFEVTPYFGLGTILRKQVYTFSYSAALEIGYRFTERFKLSSFIQFTDRTDLLRLYNDRALRYSFFVGIEFNLFKT